MSVVRLVVGVLLVWSGWCFCAGSYSLGLSTCIFYYDYSDANCTEFELQDCTWEECVEYTEVDNVTTCTQYQTMTNADWNTCTSTCCATNNPYPLQYSSLDQCQQDLKNAIIKTIIIVCSVIGGIILIVIVVVACRCLMERGDCCNSSCNCRGLGKWIAFVVTCQCLRIKRQPSPPPAKENLMNETEMSTVPINWQYPQHNQTEGQVCSVCSEQGFVVKYQCGHNFHRACMKDSLEQVRCPVCRFSLFGRIRVYCTRCFQSNFMIDFEWLSLKGRLLELVCNRCELNGQGPSTPTPMM